MTPNPNISPPAQAQAKGWAIPALAQALIATIQNEIDRAWEDGDIQHGPDVTEDADPTAPAALLLIQTKTAPFLQTANLSTMELLIGDKTFYLTLSRR